MRVEVVAEGPTRVLRLSDDTSDVADWPMIGLNQETIPDTEYIANLEGIELSLVDETPQELLFLYSRKIYVEYANSNVSQVRRQRPRIFYFLLFNIYFLHLCS